MLSSAEILRAKLHSTRGSGCWRPVSLSFGLGRDHAAELPSGAEVEGGFRQTRLLHIANVEGSKLGEETGVWCNEMASRFQLLTVCPCPFVHFQVAFLPPSKKMVRDGFVKMSIDMARGFHVAEEVDSASWMAEIRSN